MSIYPASNRRELNLEKIIEKAVIEIRMGCDNINDCEKHGPFIDRSTLFAIININLGEFHYSIRLQDEQIIDMDGVKDSLIEGLCGVMIKQYDSMKPYLKEV